MIDLQQLYRLLVRHEAEAYTSAAWCDTIWQEFAADAVAWPQFMEAVRVSLREIRFAPDLVAAADRFARKHRLEDRVGLHIRHTDNVTKVDVWRRSANFSAERVSSPAGFFREIERRPAQHFFVATDNEAIARELALRHPKRVCQLPKSFRRLSSLGEKARSTPVETALIELLLLGRCTSVIGTYFSSFSRLAAIFGQCDYAEMWGEKCVRDPVIPTTAGLLRTRTFRFAA